jgi:hypothetical protein
MSRSGVGSTPTSLLPLGEVGVSAIERLEERMRCLDPPALSRKLLQVRGVTWSAKRLPLPSC